MVLFFDDEFVATDQVVLAYGAESDRVLGIPGEVCVNDIVFSCGLLLCTIGISMVSLTDVMALDLLAFFSRIWQGYTQLENSFGGIMGTLTADILLQTWRALILQLFLVRYLLLLHQFAIWLMEAPEVPSKMQARITYFLCFNWKLDPICGRETSLFLFLISKKEKWKKGELGLR